MEQNPSLANDPDFDAQVTKEIQAFEETWTDVVHNSYGGSPKAQMELMAVVGPFAENLNNAAGGRLVDDAMAGDSQAVGDDLEYMLTTEPDYYHLMEKNGVLAMEGLHFL